MSVASLARYTLVWNEGAIISLPPRRACRSVDHRQNLAEGGHVEDRRNANDVPVGMNDFNRRPEGDGNADGKERRAVLSIAAVTNPATLLMPADAKSRLGRPATFAATNTNGALAPLPARKTADP